MTNSNTYSSDNQQKHPATKTYKGSVLDKKFSFDYAHSLIKADPNTLSEQEKEWRRRLLVRLYHGHYIHSIEIVQDMSIDEFKINLIDRLVVGLNEKEYLNRNTLTYFRFLVYCHMFKKDSDSLYDDMVRHMNVSKSTTDRQLSHLKKIKRIDKNLNIINVHLILRDYNNYAKRQNSDLFPVLDKEIFMKR
jgi:hypothetical protein